ncbi:MAG: hypothetical protein ACLP00_20295 [Terracidiphilus sp.]
MMTIMPDEEHVNCQLEAKRAAASLISHALSKSVACGGAAEMVLLMLVNAPPTQKTFDFGQQIRLQRLAI